MIKSDKKIKELAEVFKKADKNAVREAVEMLREDQPFEGAINLLAGLYDNNPDPQVRKSVTGFMNDLKDQAVCVEVIREIKKEWKSETICMLVSSCWQSRLDYSEYVLDLAELFLRSDYITAIECLTAIEESIKLSGNQKRKEVKELIENNPVSPDDEKITLLPELISILTHEYDTEYLDQ